jgi:hypothetical protein
LHLQIESILILEVLVNIYVYKFTLSCVCMSITLIPKPNKDITRGRFQDDG